mmetsp:Transcript_13714/g.38599  ORF Transcript_13714/g.38599 Transcript_13714/m.38599 type:complete len:519 (+) Transcript_13714:247-1803(+)
MQEKYNNASVYRFSELLFLTIAIALTMTTGACYPDQDKCTEDGFCENGTSPFSKSSIFIPRLKEILRQSVNALSPSTPFYEMDENAVATLIFESMYTPGRVYHSMQHVFNITQNCDMRNDPILLLSTLFHDVIYYTVDKSFQESQLEFLENVLVFENVEDDGETKEESKICLKQPLELSSDALKDPLLTMVFRLYDFKPGTSLPSFGSNEFLSAVIGVRVLSKWLSMPQLTQIAAAIEATIPFRPASSDGKTAMDRLYDRLVTVASNQSEAWLAETIHLSATMANCDLCSFDSSNFDFFLDSSWSLVPEFRPSLLKEDCPLQEYYDEFLAMEGRTKFLISAIPNIFQVFRNVPSESELTVKRARTRANLDLGNDYAQVRRLQLMVLMDFVTILGENPCSIPGRPFLRLELPKSVPLSEDEDDKLKNLLDKGRHECFPWDPSRCSLGAFLYDKLGKKGIDTAVEVGKEQKSGSSDLLEHLPKDMVAAIASTLSGVLPNRANELLEIVDKLGVSQTQAHR